jgi:WD40 repeat protein
VLAVAFRAGTGMVQAGFASGSVIAFSYDGSQAGRPLKVAGGDVHSMQFSLNGEKVAVGTSHGGLLLWDITKEYQLCPPLQGHDDIRAVTFGLSDSLVASAGEDGKVILWDVARCAPRGRPLIHTNFASAVVFSPEGKKLASGSCFDRGTFFCQSGEIRFWDVETMMPIGPPIRTHPSWVSAVAFSADGMTFASGGQDGEIQVRSATEPTRAPTELRVHDARVNSLVFGANGRMLGSAGLDGKVLLWTTPDRRPRSSRFTLAADDGRRVRVERTGDGDDTLAVFYRGQELRVAAESGDAAAVAPRGRPIAIADSHRVTLFDPEHLRKVVLGGATGLIYSLSFSADGRTLAAGDGDGVIRFWDVANNRLWSQIIHAFPSTVTALAFLADSETVVAAGCDLFSAIPEVDPCDAPVISFWNATTGAELGRRWQVPSRGDIVSIAANHDGTLVAASQCQSWNDTSDGRHECAVSAVWVWAFRVAPHSVPLYSSETVTCGRSDSTGTRLSLRVSSLNLRGVWDRLPGAKGRVASRTGLSQRRNGVSTSTASRIGARPAPRRLKPNGASQLLTRAGTGKR